MAEIGSAVLRVVPDTTGLNARMAGYFHSSDWGKLGKAAGVALGAGIAAGGAAKALYEVGQAFDDAYDKIRVGTGATGKELGKLERDFKNVVKAVPTDFGTAADAITGLNQRLDLTGRPLQKLAKQFTELSRITETDVKTNVQSVTRAFGDWEVKTRQQSEQLDKFFRASQDSGASVSELADQVVQFGAPLRQVGFSLDEATAMFAAFEEAGVNTQTMMPGLRMALRNFIEEGIDPQKGLTRAFADIESGAMDSQEALEIFGTRAGPDMVEAIKQGRFDLEDFTKSLKDHDETIRDAGRDTMDFSEHWQKFKNNVLVALEPIAIAVFEGMGEAMQKLTKIAPKVIAAIKEAFSSEGLKNAVADVKEMFHDLGPVFKFVGRVAERAFEGIKDIVDGFVQTLSGVAKFISGVFTLDLEKAFDGIKDIIAGAFEGLKGAARILTAPFRELAERIGGWLEDGPVGDSIRWLVDKIEWVIEKIEWAQDQLPSLPQGTEGFQAELEATVIPQIEGKAPDWKKALNLDGLDKTTDKVRDSHRKLWGDISQETGKGTQDAGEKIKRYGREAEGEFDNTHRKLDGTTREQARDVGGNVGGMVNQVGQALKTLGENTNKALKAFGAKSVSFSVESVGGAAADVLKKQRGGMIFGGMPSGDSVPALLERNEGVLNREAVKGLGGPGFVNWANKKWSRYQKGGVAGGLDFALGPYTIPPIQYAADHAGGNSHVHITGTTTPWVVAIGKKLQQMGFMVGEHPAFGGVTATHSATGGHYDALAIDVNSAADETRSEVASIARLLSSGKIAGAAAVQTLKRLLLQGPDGPLKSMGQGSLDMSWKAANALIAKSAPSMSGVAPIGKLPKGSFSADQMASLWSSVGGPKSVAHVAGAVGMAESMGNPRAVGPMTQWGQAMGLWQILGQVVPGDIFDPVVNAKNAVKKYTDAGGWSPWEAYTNGNYAQYLQKGGIVDAGWFGKGGSVTADRPTILGIGENGRETATITRGDAKPLKVVINGSITPNPGVSEEDVIEIVEDMTPGIIEHGARVSGGPWSRSRQLPVGA